MFHFSIDWMQTLSMLGRVSLAAVLAGVIGYEREHVQRRVFDVAIPELQH